MLDARRSLDLGHFLPVKAERIVGNSPLLDLALRVGDELWRLNAIDELLGHPGELSGIDRPVLIENQPTLFFCVFFHLAFARRIMALVKRLIFSRDHGNHRAAVLGAVAVAFSGRTLAQNEQNLDAGSVA